jgi:hypothetical protein
MPFAKETSFHMDYMIESNLVELQAVDDLDADPAS